MKNSSALQYSQRNPSRELNIVCIDNSESSRNEDYSGHIPTTRLEAQARALDAIVRLSSHKHTQYSIIAMAGAPGRTEAPSMLLTPTADAESFVAEGTEFCIGGDSISICAALNLALMTARHTTIPRRVPKRRLQPDVLSRCMSIKSGTNSAGDNNTSTIRSSYNDKDVLLNIARVIKIYLFVCSVPRDIDQLRDTVTRLSSTIGDLLVTVHLVSFGEALHNVKCIRSFGVIKELSTAFPSTKVIRVVQHKLPENAETISSGYIGSLLLEKLAGKPHNSAKKDIGTCAETLSDLLFERKKRFLRENNGRNNRGVNGALLSERPRVPPIRIPGPVKNSRSALANDNCAALQPYIVEKTQPDPVRISFNVSYLSRANIVTTFSVPISLYAEDARFKIPAGMCKEHHAILPGSQKQTVVVECCQGEGILVIQSLNSAVYSAFWVDSQTGAIQFRVYFFKGELKVKLTRLPDGRALVLTVTRRETRFKKVFWIQVPESEMSDEQIEEELNRCVDSTGSYNPITKVLASPVLNTSRKYAPPHGVSPCINSCTIIPTPPPTSFQSQLSSLSTFSSSSSSTTTTAASSSSSSSSSSVSQQQHSNNQQPQENKAPQVNNGNRLTEQQIAYRNYVRSLIANREMIKHKIKLLPLEEVLKYVPLPIARLGTSNANDVTNPNGSNKRVNNSSDNGNGNQANPNKCSAAETTKENMKARGVNNKTPKVKRSNYCGATKKVKQPSKRNPRAGKKVEQPSMASSSNAFPYSSPSQSLVTPNAKERPKTEASSIGPEKANDAKVVESENTNYAVDSVSGLRRSLRIRNKLKTASSSLEYGAADLIGDKNAIKSGKSDDIPNENTTATIVVGEGIVENACNTSDDVIMGNHTSSNGVNGSGNKENIEVESSIECNTSSSTGPTSNGLEQPQK